jgi:CRISPR/Cas system-associated protein Cas7 (RAMP superfamily)
MKAINAVWMARTDLTNLNSGIGGSNLVDVKKYKLHGIDYPYVSGQAMRYYWKEAIRRLITPNDYCVANDKGETCGDIEGCILDDLFGFMLTSKGETADKRVSPIKMSPAMGLLPLSDNLTIDLLVRMKNLRKDDIKLIQQLKEIIKLNVPERKKSISELKEKVKNMESVDEKVLAIINGNKIMSEDAKKIEEVSKEISEIDRAMSKGFDMPNVELTVNLYKAGFSIDVAKVGGEEKIDPAKRKSKGIDYELKGDKRKERILLALKAFKNISDFSKQARVLTDFSPDIILLSTQDNYNHLIQKALEIRPNSAIELHTERLDDILSDLNKSGNNIFAGLLSGAFKNEEKIREIFTKHKLTITTPQQSIDKVYDEINKLTFEGMKEK